MIRMTKRSACTILGAAALAALPLTAPAQAPTPAAPAARSVTLRYKFTPGQVHRYKVTMNTAGTMTTSQSGTGYPLNSATQIVMKQTVKDVRASDGAATITTEFESMRFAMNGKEQTLSVAQQTAMKEPITQVMLSTGKVLLPTSTGLSAMLSDAPEMPMPGIDFGKSFSSLSVAFPDGPLKPGESWKDTVPLLGIEGSNLIFDSTLTSLTGDGDAARANIDQKISRSLVGDPSQGAPMDTKMVATMTILGTGTMAFNTAQGVVQSLTNDSSINMPLPLIKMQVRQKTTMELLPDAAAAPTN